MVVPTRVLIKTDWVEQLVRVSDSVYLGQSGASPVPRQSWKAERCRGGGGLEV